MKNKVITVETTVKAPVEKVWSVFTDPKHITGWCNASDDWHAPYAENDLRVNGKFKTTMAAKDGSVKFDFTGFYTKVEKQKEIDYTMDDGRKVKIVFSKHGHETRLVESFEPESVNSMEMQKGGWQSILDNFKKYTEKKS